MERHGDLGLIPMVGGVVNENRSDERGEIAADVLSAGDLEWIREIVRQVIARLRANDMTHATGTIRITQRVVTAQTIEQIKESVRSVAIRSDAVVTPAAKDAARQRGITLQRCTQRINKKNYGEHQQPNHLIDTDDPNRREIVESQLRRRGVVEMHTRIVLTDSPAATVIREVNGGEVAVMVSSLDEVDRFAAECNPTSWVLDMKRLNLPGAVNVAALITKLGSLAS